MLNLAIKTQKNPHVYAWNRFAKSKKRKSLIIGIFTRTTHAKSCNFIEKKLT